MIGRIERENSMYKFTVELLYNGRLCAWRAVGKVEGKTKQVTGPWIEGNGRAWEELWHKLRRKGLI